MGPKATLRRLVLAGDRVEVDPEQRRPGRGAYVCDAACARDAISRRAFQRAFRRAVTVPDNVLESI